jgi:hypothetical protein
VRTGQYLVSRRARDGPVADDQPAEAPSNTDTKISPQPQVSVCGDCKFSRNNVANALSRLANAIGLAVFGQAKGLQELFFNHGARRTRVNDATAQAHTSSSVVDYLHISGAIGSR